jgi:O-antigen/teichoic acid export membrane protein
MESASHHRDGVLSLGDFLRQHLALILILSSCCFLVLFPLADCFDCEGPSPWGRNDAAFAIRSTVFFYLLVSSSALAGLLRCRLGWLVPVAIVPIAGATERLGGVPLWSLIRNEGPVMLIFGGAVGLIVFLAGLVVRVAADGVRKLLSHLRA